MAYGKKYSHVYCNSEGTNCEVAVYEIDYEGAVVVLEASPIPFTKAYSSATDFKFDPIRPTVGSASFIFKDGDGIDFEEFWTADERKFQLQHFIGAVIDWTGYVIPNGFKYQLKGGYYTGVLSAADGLSTLSDIPFSYSEVAPYGTQNLTYNNGFEFPFSLIATEILRKLELDLDTWICVDVYERTMTKTGNSRAADPLANSYANVKTYINDTSREDIPYWRDANEVMDCDRVLRNLCQIFGAKVYQSKGVWKIKRVNADADFGAGDTQRYWRKYNTASVYIGQEIINDEIFVPCATVSKAMIGNDHLLSMDDVFGAFRINYDYTFVRDGDNPVNLIKNGTFADWTPTSKYDAPREWFRWRYRNNLWYSKARPSTAIADEAGGNTTALEMGIQPIGLDGGDSDRVAKTWSSIRYANDIPVTKGDKLSLSLWQKTQQQFSDPRAHAVSALYMARLDTAFGKTYFLRNDPGNADHGLRYLGWFEADLPDQTNDYKKSTSKDVFFWLRGGIGQAVENDNIQPINTNGWRRFEMYIQDVPEAGNITFDIRGIGSRSMPTSKFNPPLNVYEIGLSGLELVGYGPVRTEFFDSGAAKNMQVTGIQFGKIPNESEQPEGQDYIYENQTGRYTLQVDPITILNGDTQDQDHVSNIIVPSNVSDGKNFWDTIDNKYGLSSLGLITCKSIMNLYIKPFRLLEGTIKAPGATMDTRFEFEALPGRFFSILRATFNEKKNYIEDCTFFEISSIAIADGGTEGSNSLDPNWIQTGNYQCVKYGPGDMRNSGMIQYQERDVNPNSDTYGQLRYAVAEANIAVCPIGEAEPFYWGTDGVVLDVANLTTMTPNVYYDDVALKDVYQFTFNNPGGEYIYLVHLQSIGLVESVFTDSQNEIISDFQYLADIVLDGFTYKVYRQEYITADFEDFPISFKFS